LRDPNKRENEFQALCRNEVTVDFWTELIASGAFTRRLQAYEKHMRDLERFRRCEARFKGVAAEYFTLFDGG
jgi:hypothetical protein